MSKLVWILIDDDTEKTTTPYVENRIREEYVYIVRRNDINTEFVYRHFEDAVKCKRRLKEMYPYEEISLDKYVIREDYL